MKAALVISSRDNVATALQPLEPGLVLDLEGGTLKVAERVPPGHKIALRTIASGDPIVKYGSPIGTASMEIAAGTHVHTHNVVSGRGRGDLEATAAGDEGRLAEPADDAVAGNGPDTLKNPGA
jgi:SAF domain